MARAAAAAVELVAAAVAASGPNPSLKLAWPALSNLWSPCHQLTQPLQLPTARAAAAPVAAAGVGEVVEVIAGKAVTTSSISEAVAMPQPLVRRQPRRQARQQWVTITTEAGEPRLVKVTSAVMEVTRVTDGTSKVTVAIIGNRRPPDNLILKLRGQTATEVKAPPKVPNIMTNLI